MDQVLQNALRRILYAPLDRRDPMFYRLRVASKATDNGMVTPFPDSQTKSCQTVPDQIIAVETVIVFVVAKIRLLINVCCWSRTLLI